MAKIVTLGEIMLRLSPEGNERFIQSDSFRIILGGGDGLNGYAEDVPHVELGAFSCQNVLFVACLTRHHPTK